MKMKMLKCLATLSLLAGVVPAFGERDYEKRPPLFERTDEPTEIKISGHKFKFRINGFQYLGSYAETGTTRKAASLLGGSVKFLGLRTGSVKRIASDFFYGVDVDGKKVHSNMKDRLGITKAVSVSVDDATYNFELKLDKINLAYIPDEDARMAATNERKEIEDQISVISARIQARYHEAAPKLTDAQAKFDNDQAEDLNKLTDLKNRLVTMKSTDQIFKPASPVYVVSVKFLPKVNPMYSDDEAIRPASEPWTPPVIPVTTTPAQEKEILDLMKDHPVVYYSQDVKDFTDTLGRDYTLSLSLKNSYGNYANENFNPANAKAFSASSSIYKLDYGYFAGYASSGTPLITVTLLKAYQHNPQHMGDYPAVDGTPVQFFINPRYYTKFEKLYLSVKKADVINTTSDGTPFSATVYYVDLKQR